MGNCNSYSLVEISLSQDNYPVYFGDGLLRNKQLFSSLIKNKVLIVTNDTLEPLYLDILKITLGEIPFGCVILEDGEEFKNSLSLNAIYEVLSNNYYHRDTTIIALGGGVIGDIAGFAAATYKRGINLIHIPTTLMAQVDSAIGGKTAINYGRGKNLIGAFYQPKAVVVDFQTLGTLPLREFQSGLAEVFKYALIEGGDFYDLFEKFVHAQENSINIALNSQLLYSLIKKSCEIKSAIVCQDEKEVGVRALLNLGHTFAHAIESYYDYKKYLHGEAVSIGLYCQALLSCSLGLLQQETVSLIDGLLFKLKLPRRLPADIDINKLYSLFLYDKKIQDEKIRFILLEDVGKPTIVNDVEKEMLLKVLSLARI